MRFLFLGASLIFATFFVVTILASAVAALVWRLSRRELERTAPAKRANGLLLLRLLPASAAAVVTTGIVLPAFHVFEPRDTQEAIGISLGLLALGTVAFVLRGLHAAWQKTAATRAVLGNWTESAERVSVPGSRWLAYRIESLFPVVSVAGTWRPRLYVASRVLDGCSSEELEAVLAHEAGHLAAADNLKRLVVACCPDFPWFRRSMHEIEARWHEAIEEAADDFAIRHAGRAPLDLAAALVKVARLATSAWPPYLHASTISRGEDLERRIRRLLDHRQPRPSVRGWLVASRLLAAVAPIMALGVLIDPDRLRAVHAVIEVVVATLP